jgi:hypothetical protein
MVAMTDDKPPGTQLEHWVNIGATIIAPTTLLGALLFYFGYVSSRAQYAYFGVDVDTIGLSTQDYIMRSPQPLLMPLLVLTLGGAGLFLLQAAVRGHIASAVADAADETNTAGPGGRLARHLERIHRMARWSKAFGLAMIAAGVVLLFSYRYLGNWAFYALVTPLLIAVGTALTAYASRILQSMQRASPTAKDAGHRVPALADGSRMARWTAAVLVYVVIAATIFWATATFAQWLGLGLAEREALSFGNLPSVILDTRERLFLHDPYVGETVLPPSEGQTFHYRYRGLRLLIEGQDRMFLVPDEWSASDSTLIVPLDGSVRVQFQFKNQPP